MMMQAARRHPLLSAGLAAPLALALYVLLTSWLPGRWSTPPVYDLLYLTNYSPEPINGLVYEVRGDKLHFTYIGENFGFGWPRLFRMNPANGAVREIRIMWPRHIPLLFPNRRPPPPPQVLRRPVPVPEADAMRIQPGFTSPDGYRFIPVTEGKEDLSQLFNLHPRPLLGTVEKFGRRIPVPAPAGPRTRDPVTFIGWVLS